MVVWKLLIVSSIVSQINATGHNLKCLNKTKKFFFSPKENSLLNYMSWSLLLSVLAKGECNWASLRKWIYLPWKAWQHNWKNKEAWSSSKLGIGAGLRLVPVPTMTCLQKPTCLGGQWHSLVVTFCESTESKEKSFNPARNLSPLFSWPSGRCLPSAFILGQLTCDGKKRQGIDIFNLGLGWLHS